MRERKRKDRKLSQPPFEIDLIVPGLGTVTGKGDRFRCSAETRDAKVLQERRKMVHDLGQRLLHDVLAARLAGRFTTEQLALAYKQGTDALKALLDESQRTPLSALRDRWMQIYPGRNKADYLRQLNSFIEFCGGDSKATVADLNTEKVGRWLASLTDRRRGRAGARITSNSVEAIADRERRRRKRECLPPRPVSAATRNRHRTAISAFCTFLVNVAGVLKAHPLRDKRLPSLPEPEGRMPHLEPSKWAAYCDYLAADPLAPAESVIVARILRHTGADVGEVIGYMRGDGVWVPGLLVSDIHAKRALPRIRLKRQKVDKSPARLVPYPPRHMAELEKYIGTQKLTQNDVLFGMVDRFLFEAAHRRACKAIGQPDLRLKDFRHLAAIAWAQAGVRLERIKDWLGHSTIKLTEIYTKFAPDDAFDEPAAERAANLAEGAA